MIEPGLDGRWAALARSVRHLLQVTSIDQAVEVVRTAGREVAAADGVAIVRRHGDECAYIAEDSIAPLWAGQRFPMRQCVSGMAMETNRSILIPDIMRDDRVPLNLYLATYVRRLAIFPFGMDKPVGALCAYWRDEGEIDEETAALLGSMARAMAGVFETLFILERAAKRAEIPVEDLI